RNAAVQISPYISPKLNVRVIEGACCTPHQSFDDTTRFNGGILWHGVKHSKIANNETNFNVLTNWRSR
ncbi:TPA: hypothetical protein ACWCBK_003825, partial [Escherichia coli]